jgi:hypothetical protein
MKLVQLFFLLITPLVLLGNTSNTQEGRAYRAAVVSNVLHRSAEKFQKQYPISPIGTLIGMPGGIVEKLGLDFQSKRLLTKEEVRNIVVRCACDFLREINADERLRPLMCIYPFTLEHIDITIYNALEDGSYVCDPEIGVASIWNNQIVYTIWGDTETLDVKRKVKESFKEAQAVILSSSP